MSGSEELDVVSIEASLSLSPHPPHEELLPTKWVTLPTKPCRVTLGLVGKAYAATCPVLQTYLLKDLDEGKGIGPEVVRELCQVTDLALHATKQTACSTGCLMAGMVVVERHLLLSLLGIKERNKAFLIDAQLLHLTSDTVRTVVERFQEAKKQLAAFSQFIPCHVQATGSVSQHPSHCPWEIGLLTPPSLVF